MLMIKAIVRPEKCDEVMKGLFEAGYPGVTKVPVYGRGKQRGIKIGEVHYDELPKEMLIIVIPEDDKDFVVKTIIECSRTGEGNYGDGKIFIQQIEASYTISSGVKEV